MRLVRPGPAAGGRGSARRSRGMLVAASLALLAAGCHVPPAGPGQAVSQQITVAVVPGSRTRRCRWRSEDGLFAQHHLDVTVQTYHTLQRAYAALASGQAEVISGDYAGLLYVQAQASGARLRLIADGYDATPGLMEVLTLPGSAITAPQDLQGKAVATPPRGARPVLGGRPLQRRDAGHRGGAAERRGEPVQRAVDGHARRRHDHGAARPPGQRHRGHPALHPAGRNRARRGGAVRRLQRRDRQPAAVRVLHHGRLRPRPRRGPA